jgi:hypothetical protein
LAFTFLATGSRPQMKADCVSPPSGAAEGMTLAFANMGEVLRIASRKHHRNPLSTAPPFFWKKNQKGRAVADTENGIPGDRLVRGTGCAR